MEVAEPDSSLVRGLIQRTREVSAEMVMDIVMQGRQGRNRRGLYLYELRGTKSLKVEGEGLCVCKRERERERESARIGTYV